MAASGSFDKLSATNALRGLACDEQEQSAEDVPAGVVNSVPDATGDAAVPTDIDLRHWVIIRSSSKRV